MKASFTLNEAVYPLTQIEERDMDSRLSDKQTKDLAGYPFYFDARKRLWPKPTDGLLVVFTDD